MDEPVAGERMGLSGFAALYPTTGSSSRTTFATTAARLPGTNRLTFDTAGGIIIFVERIAVYPHM